jgi:hypothetical protein
MLELTHKVFSLYFIWESVAVATSFFFLALYKFSGALTHSFAGSSLQDLYKAFLSIFVE